jgi:hypothetical protein
MPCQQAHPGRQRPLVLGQPRTRVNGRMQSGVAQEGHGSEHRPHGRIAAEEGARAARPPGAWAEATTYIVTSGRLEGSIIAAVITCQASRKNKRAGPNTGPLSSRLSWCTDPAAPLSSTATAATQATAMAARTGEGTPRRAASGAGTETRKQPRPGSRSSSRTGSRCAR